MTVPCVIYGAKSTTDKHASIPEQITEAMAMAAEQGWTVVGTFSDEGFSAYSGNRGPGLEAAKRRAAEAAAENRTTAMLLAQAHDRFARAAGDRPGAPQSLGEVWHQMRRLSVHLRTVEDDEELRDEAAVAAIGRRAFIDSQRKSKSVRKGMVRRAQRGKLAGGPRPYGYRWNGPRGEQSLVVVPAEAAVVRRVFEDFDSGMSQRAVERALNGEGIPTATGSEWFQGTIAKLLRNPLYVGKLRHDGEVYDGRHDAIIDAHLWDRVQAMLRTRARTRGHGGGRLPKGAHLLTKGLLRCGHCGEALIPRAETDKYECFRQKRHGRDSCPQKPIPRAGVDEPMLAGVLTLLLDMDEMREQAEQRIDTDTARVAAMREQGEQEVARTQNGRDRVERDYLAGDLSAANYERLSGRLEAELLAARSEVERLAGQERTLREQRPLLDPEAHVLRRLADLRRAVAEGVGKARDLDALRRLLRDFLERVDYLAPACEMYSLLPDDLADGAPKLLPKLRRFEQFSLPAETEAVGLVT